MTLKEQIMKLQTYKMYEGEDTVYVERDDVLKLLEQQPCEDCISRKDFIAKIEDIYNGYMLDEDGCSPQDFVDLAEEMPPVTPQPKIGEWLEKEVIDNSHKVIEEWQSARCSVCDKYHTTPYMYYFSKYNFCPNCGAQMEKEAET